MNEGSIRSAASRSGSGLLNRVFVHQKISVIIFIKNIIISVDTVANVV